MIPHTYPSTLNSSNQTQMVVYVLPDITGLTKWVDYIPVKPPASIDTSFANTFAAQGYILTETLTSISGKQAWLDYIPVYIDYSATTAFSTDATGYVPMDAFQVLNLFGAGEQGVWYDPSDLTTLFQDEAGTTPVTAVEQPVSRMLDKSGRGNHATTPAAASASRPTLSARVNLLTYSEQFDNAAWTKTRISVSANAIVAPDGTLTADKIVENTDTNTHALFRGSVGTIGVTETLSIYAKAAERNWINIQFSGLNAYFNLSSGALGAVDVGLIASIVSVGDGWYRCAVSGVRTNTNNLYFIASANSVISYTGNGTSGVYVWGAELRANNDGVGLPVYQRIAAATDYDTVGFPRYLRFDGSDDYMLTGSINFSATDKMTVFAGVRKSSDAAAGVAVELSSSIAANNGAFLLSAPSSAAANFNFASKGTTQQDNVITTYTAPLTRVLSGLADISGNVATIRVNSSQVASNTGGQGTGNYGNYPIYIGRRGGTTLPFNGRLYSLIVRGAQSTAAEISNTENYVNSKTKAY